MPATTTKAKKAFSPMAGARAMGRFARLNQIDPDTDEGKFCIAMMLRGGVLGEAGGKEKAESAPAGAPEPAEAQA